MAGVVDIDAFVHEACAGIGGDEGADAPGDLGIAGGIVGSGEGAHDDAHGPCHVVADVGTADALEGLAAEEVGVVGAPDEAAGVEIDRVVGRDNAEIGHGQQAGHIGVVHQQGVAEAIDLERIDGTVLGMGIDGILLQGCGDLVGQRRAVGSELVAALDLDAAQDLGGIAELGHGEEVRGDKEREGGGIV